VPKILRFRALGPQALRLVKQASEQPRTVNPHAVRGLPKPSDKNKPTFRRDLDVAGVEALWGRRQQAPLGTEITPFLHKARFDLPNAGVRTLGGDPTSDCAGTSLPVH
jgi:hypothetical protein